MLLIFYTIPVLRRFSNPMRLRLSTEHLASRVGEGGGARILSRVQTADCHTPLVDQFVFPSLAVPKPAKKISLSSRSLSFSLPSPTHPLVFFQIRPWRRIFEWQSWESSELQVPFLSGSLTRTLYDTEYLQYPLDPIHHCMGGDCLTGSPDPIPG